MLVLATYLHALATIRATGAATPETSYYTPLENLFNAVGAGLKPTVRAVFQLSDLGAGRPDFGLFAAGQFERPADGVSSPERRAGALPERGAGEVKGPGEALDKLLAGKQVSKYWDKYRQVLVTNLRQFAFVAELDGKPLLLDSFELAKNEAEFWTMCHASTPPPPAVAASFTAFLERCLRHAAPLDEPKDLAWFLAAFAREARQRLELADPAHLQPLRTALEETLGVRFDGEKGARFLRATVVQTLFYGVFSAWVLWHRDTADDPEAAPFAWRNAPDYLQLPVMQVLFEQVGTTSFLKNVKLRDLLDRTDLVLARVNRARFFGKFAETEAIQYFYEPFLEAYDPQLRKELGVWYTPPEVVRYMVARVDWALRTQLNIPDGLADERVVVLDPCCGTGTFLVEVLRHLAAALEAQGAGALRAEQLRKAATERLFGFEILTAPFVVAHLQLGLALREFGAPLPPEARAAVYLTNALTGWDPAKHEKQLTTYPALRKEAEAARHVKRDERIVVILGNPPYDGYAGLSAGGSEEDRLAEAYRHPRRTAPPQGQGLNDLYVRFFRMAERQIAERTRQGLVCFVANYSWLDGLSHPGLRERFLEAFDGIWIDNLNGDKYATGKTTPDGRPDPSVFSTPFNREGIQVGAAVSLLVRAHDRPEADGAAPASDAVVHYRDFWGKDKRAELAAIAAAPEPTTGPAYLALLPNPALGLPFKPRAVADEYLTWPTLPQVFPASFPGVKTSRDEALVSIDRAELEARMQRYFDPAVTDAQLEAEHSPLMASGTDFNATNTRRQLLPRGFRPESVIPFMYRPLDVRWLYWENETKLLDRSRPEYQEHILEGNPWLFTTARTRKSIEPPIYSEALTDLNLMDSGARGIPLYLAPDMLSAGERRPNLSHRASEYLTALGAPPETLFYHALAVLHAPTYREQNAGALRQDWPRLPLPASLAALDASAALGREVAALLDVRRPVPTVTHGAIRPELRAIGAPQRRPGAPDTGLHPAEGHFGLRARWGTRSNGTVVPGAGRTTPTPDQPDHLDIWLNDEACWAAVPAAVWATTLGGYPVLKKWLSYRAAPVLGRDLTMDEVQEFMRLVRRLAALLALSPSLNAAYNASTKN
ncbi:type ISP restriction/modification enzyme [Hymenobacter elongatus]|uniref:site-specific DNA-methyltransferase (adenine-specific) n=1 Tax=Hymenobacter elongatus TaxID=877208 RepID=A0A4Z0PQW8_9BACT|nr:type ISP restriction/modification enzyme [Hymenobacter elongatus]TGE20117.1 DNA methyltransferase [Hymenobacter elongatus]